ncbi:MAG: hypothetical protein ABIU97_07345 [Dehalococcoidia bacterium]
MPGMIHAPKPGAPQEGAPTPAGSEAGGDVEQMLEKKKQDVTSKVNPAIKADFDAIVKAGGTVLWSEQSHDDANHVMEAIQSEGHHPDDIATAMVNLLTMIFKGSKGKMKIEAAYPAAVVLLCQVLQFMAATHELDVTPDLLKAIGKSMANKFVQAFKIDVQESAEPTETGNQPAGQPVPAGAEGV